MLTISCIFVASHGLIHLCHFSHFKQYFGQLQWHKLLKAVLWQCCSRVDDALCIRSFKTLKRGLLQDNLLQKQLAPHSKLSLDPILNAAEVFVGDLVGCLVVKQSPVPSILTALFPRNRLSSVSICIEGYKWRLLPRIPCLFFWTYYPFANHAPFNPFSLGFSVSPAYVWFFLSSITFITSILSRKITLNCLKTHTNV